MVPGCLPFTAHLSKQYYRTRLQYLWVPLATTINNPHWNTSGPTWRHLRPREATRATVRLPVYDGQRGPCHAVPWARTYSTPDSRTQVLACFYLARSSRWPRSWRSSTGKSRRACPSTALPTSALLPAIKYLGSRCCAGHRIFICRGRL